MGFGSTEERFNSHDEQSLLSSLKNNLIQARHDRPHFTGLQEEQEQGPLIWYFAYGSNMSTEKFTHSRGIIPIATVNAELPGWCLTMEVPGLPYAEPGMSSIARRELLHPPSSLPSTINTKSNSLTSSAAAFKIGKENHDFWPNDKIPTSRLQNVMGVAYLVTQQQYVRVIRSEGGGIAYDGFELDAVGITGRDREILSRHGGDREGNVKVCTLVNVPSMSRRGKEPLPSGRYKKLLTSGAAEAGLPESYQDMLKDWPAFIAPSRRAVDSIRKGPGDSRGDDDDNENLKRWIGALIFLAIWKPLLSGMEKLTYRYIRDRDGLVPMWVKWIVRAAVWVIWWNHDVGFALIFGRGDGREDLDWKTSKAVARSNQQSRQHARVYTYDMIDCEKGPPPAECDLVSTLQGRKIMDSKYGTKMFWTSLS